MSYYTYYDQSIAKPRNDGGYMDPIDEPPCRGADACEPTAPADKAGCTKKRLRFLSSQETPLVDPSTQEQTGSAPRGGAGGKISVMHA
jgi:hypothetical protein